MLSKKKKVEHKAKSEEDLYEEPQTYLTFVNNQLHSLFFNCEVYFNNTVVYNANGLYPHKAEISNEFNSSAVSNKKNLLVMDTVLKNILMHLICIHSLIEQSPWKQG